VRHFADRERKGVADSNFLSHSWGVAVRERGPYLRRAFSGDEELSAGANRLARNLMRAIHRRPASEQHGANEPVDKPAIK
jgi:hypothetical protein